MLNPAMEQNIPGAASKLDATGARVILIDDEPSITRIVKHHLEAHAIEVTIADTTAAALKRLATARFHAVICDLVMEGGGGLEILRYVQAHTPQTPVIIMTGYADEQAAERCFATGAFDFLSKPIERLDLFAVLRRALLRSGVVFEDAPTPAPPTPAPPTPAQSYANLVGTSMPMRDIFSQIAKVAETDANVCVYGETGTGKELVARAIHYFSHRAKRALIVFDCAAIPEGLMESELFGHVKGSFTSAVSDRDGVFQLADGGTLFLDEVGELSLPLQAKLLRVIQCREFRRVGGKHPIKVDVRIIAATNKDMGGMVATGTFREDLYYRLEVIPITLPPLRDRKEDIPLLVDHFIQKFNRNNRKQIRGVSSNTMGTLLRYHWPGNVRELENCIERAAVMTDGNTLDLQDLSKVLRTQTAPAPQPAATEQWPRSLKEGEHDLIIRTLQGVQGNRTRAAELLGISLRGLHYKLKEMQESGVFPPSANGSTDTTDL